MDNNVNALPEEDVYPFEISGLPEFFERKARLELDQTPERRIQSFKHFKDLIKRDKNTTNMEFNEDFLLLYLRARKYDAHKAFAQLKSFINLKRKNPGMFKNFQFEKLVLAFKNKIVTVLPWRCQDGCAIILVQLNNWIPEEFSVEDIKKIVIIILAQSVRTPMTLVNGIKFIFDAKSSMYFRQLQYVTPQNLYLMINAPQSCVAARYKAIHIVNDTIIARIGWMIGSRFLSDKLKKRAYFHSSSETLLNHFPRKCLPVEYGGTLEDYDMSDWLQKMMDPVELEIMLGAQYPQGYKPII